MAQRQTQRLSFPVIDYASASQAWLRAGYMRNSTRHTNRSTGHAESGNYCAYGLLDYQLRMPNPAPRRAASSWAEQP